MVSSQRSRQCVLWWDRGCFMSLCCPLSAGLGDASRVLTPSLAVPREWLVLLLPEPLSGHEGRGVQEKLRTAGRRGELYVRGEFQPCLSNVLICAPPGSESAPSAICMSIIFSQFCSVPRVLDFPLSQFSLCIVLCQEPSIMSRVLKAAVSWLRWRSGVHYLRCRVCFVYTVEAPHLPVLLWK